MQLQIQLNFSSSCNYYAQWFLQSLSGLMHSLTVKITTISFLSLIPFSSDANWTDFSQPNQSAINYFIEFQPGIYNQPIDTNIEKLLSEADEEEYEGEDITQHLQVQGKKQSRSDDENSKDGDDLKLGNKFSSRARRLQIFEKITIEDK